MGIGRGDTRRTRSLSSAKVFFFVQKFSQAAKNCCFFLQSKYLQALKQNNNEEATQLMQTVKPDAVQRLQCWEMR